MKEWIYKDEKEEKKWDLQLYVDVCIYIYR